MNYYTHGLRFIGDPYFLAGTACPDWLSVSDRQVRLRSRHVAPHAGLRSANDGRIRQSRWQSMASLQVVIPSECSKPGGNDHDFQSTFATREQSSFRAFAAGVMQHLSDDEWFHGTRAFYETPASWPECSSRSEKMMDFVPVSSVTLPWNCCSMRC